MSDRVIQLGHTTLVSTVDVITIPPDDFPAWLFPNKGLCSRWYKMMLSMEPFREVIRCLQSAARITLKDPEPRLTPHLMHTSQTGKAADHVISPPHAMHSNTAACIVRSSFSISFDNASGPITAPGLSWAATRRPSSLRLRSPGEIQRTALNNENGTQGKDGATCDTDPPTERIILILDSNTALPTPNREPARLAFHLLPPSNSRSKRHAFGVSETGDRMVALMRRAAQETHKELTFKNYEEGRNDGSWSNKAGVIVVCSYHRNDSSHRRGDSKGMLAVSKALFQGSKDGRIAPPGYQSSLLGPE
ncbi:hypothetical protein M407DRAFT_11253 [Tulasnella calospora MUT 4182]|uniref:Uncharacterized protein n=1 Tax=Tulasnella calospora MUT 4182 TaxID=1051891 RepID=A0A0C3Q7W6_9AGAM|nr:hypothetical protein M407DRAFT_11253 [Tulasnella calospora MUT 4182]